MPNNIEETFFLSWQRSKKVLYQELETMDDPYGYRKDRAIKVLELLETLEKLGYSKKINLGLCMLGMILSRSMDLNFDGSQHFMLVGVDNDQSYHYGYLDENTDYLTRRYPVFKSFDLINHPPFFEMLEKLHHQKIS